MTREFADASGTISDTRDREAPFRNDGARTERRSLDPQHVALLAARAISKEVALRCGLYTERIKRRVRDDLGFGERQARVPCLVIPIHDPAGEIAHHQIRPDEPLRSADGKLIKYAIPAKTVPTLCVPPIVSRDDLLDLGKTLFVCESPLKAIALAAAGAGAVVALLGIASGRTGSRGRDRGALAAWGDIPLRGREVVLIPDSDVAHNPNVHAAVRALGAFLERRGAQAKYVLLRHADDGKVVGVDDFLARGKTREEVFALIRDELPPPPVDPGAEIEDGDAPSHPYDEHQGQTWHYKRTADGATPILLANFTARIERETMLDDGAERTAHYDVTLHCNGREIRDRVPASRFSALGWISAADAIITPGQACRDHLRAAIQHLSTPVDRVIAYGHTGWRKIDGVGWAYLHADGAVGPTGPVAGVQTQLADLPHYRLPDPPEGDALREAVRASLRVLDVGPLRVTAPVVGATYRAPIGATTASVFVAGKTGRRKTALVALAQQHYGAAMDGEHLPGNWTSTENMLEAQAFLAADAVLVIDDFCPAGSVVDHARHHARAARIFRAAGNRSARRRMRPDLSLAPARPPRCLVIATGEDVPRGQSIRARMFLAEVGEDDVDLKKLTACQADAAAGLLAAAMAGYVAWLAPQLDDVRRRHVEIHRELRDAARSAGGHARVPANLAELASGVGWFLEFAVDVRALEIEQAKQTFADALEALAHGSRSTARYLSDTDAASRFLELLLAAITTGEAHVADTRTGGAPEPSPEAYGWRRGDGASGWHVLPGSKLVGWLAGEEVWLEPQAAYGVVCAQSQRQGEAFSVGPTAIAKRLHEAGCLLRVEPDSDGATRYAVRETVPAIARRVRVLALGRSTWWETGPTGPDAAKPTSALRFVWPGFAKTTRNEDRATTCNTGPRPSPAPGPEIRERWPGKIGPENGRSEPRKIAENPASEARGPIGPVPPRGETPEGHDEIEAALAGAGR